MRSIPWPSSARFPSRLARRVLVTLLASSALLIVGCSAEVGSGASDPEPVAQLGVDALMLDPVAYTGLIAVTGVVVDVSPETSGVTLIDPSEYEMCGLNPCAGTGMLPLFMPFEGEPTLAGALYAGQLPELADTVVAVGTVRSAESGLYFDVERIERGSSALIRKQ